MNLSDRQRAEARARFDDIAGAITQARDELDAAALELFRLGGLPRIRSMIADLRTRGLLKGRLLFGA